MPSEEAFWKVAFGVCFLLIAVLFSIQTSELKDLKVEYEKMEIRLKHLEEE